MTEGVYHTLIKKEIYKIAQESKKHKRVVKERKIPIPHPSKSILPIMYLPEVCITTKHGKKYIFEILDSQAGDYNLIIADIVQAYLVENVSKIFFIVKTQREGDLAYRLSEIIGTRLEENGYNKQYLPEVTVYEIDKVDLSPTTLNKTLLDFAKKDKWA